jgi:FAD/FMN-containing dehydrogenase
MAQAAADANVIEELNGNFGGAILREGDEGYDAARAVFNAMVDRRPALIARCTGVADVISAVNFARERDLQVAVRGGGHGVVGYAVCDDGIVIDLSQMKGIRVDPKGRTATAQAGVTWGEFDRETQMFGLATTGGRITTTGIAGLTLGSGSGWLERKFGFTVDNLLSVDVVTADGGFLTASEDENEELFWGLRGGGGNFGIVTSFEYRLHELGPIVAGGLLAYPRDRAPEILRAWRDHMAQAPDEVCGGFAFITAPPEEFVPEEVRLQPVCGVVFLYAGPPDEGMEAAQALKNALGEPPALDLVGPMPYTIVQTLLDAGNPFGRHQYWKSDHIHDFSDPVVDTLIEHANRVQSPSSVVILEPKGGAIDRVDEDAVAVPGRGAACAFYGIAQWENPSESDTHIAWARGLGEAMKPYASGDIPLNFVMDEGQERVQSSYGPEKYKRLVALKDEYDPHNLFRLNQNIKPSGAGRAS